MQSNRALVLLTIVFVSALSCKADTAPFGIASAYNLFAVGTVDSHGNPVLRGDINTGADVTGRIAAAGVVIDATTIGSSLNADPWGALAPFDLVGNQGIVVGNSVNINSHGNVYGLPPVNTHFNFNGGGHLVTTGGSGIDFDALRTALDAETAYLGVLTAHGTVVGANSGIPNVNPSFFVLLGTDPDLNVFDITAAELASTNNPLDIIAPTGSTIIINVSGTAITVGGPISYNGTQHAGDDADDNKILFNFPTATAVHINGQFSASALAPYAVLGGSAQMDGNFIAAQIGATGEVHNVEFTGNLPHAPTGPPIVPEPGTLLLAGTGAASLAAALRRKIRA